MTRARRLTDDMVEPYYISDTEMYQHISEAERALAVSGKLLRTVKTYPLVEDQRWVNLKTIPEVIEFKSAELINSDGQRYPLKLLGTMDPPTRASSAYLEDYALYSVSTKLTPDRPRELIFGKKTNYAEVSPVSNDAYTIEASVIIYPSFEIASGSDEPSIAERYHAAIPIGAALFAIGANEFEHFTADELRIKLPRLEGAWQQALVRAAKESGAISRDAAPVAFTNDMWY